jgi:cell division protein FtsI (penicillin-binding protein 3)
LRVALRPAKTWRPIEQATISYGHGVSGLAVQLARAAFGTGRDGELVSLSLAGGGVAGWCAFFA